MLDTEFECDASFWDRSQTADTVHPRVWQMPLPARQEIPEVSNRADSEDPRLPFHPRSLYLEDGFQERW